MTINITDGKQITPEADQLKKKQRYKQPHKKSEGFYDLSRHSCNPGKSRGSLKGMLKNEVSNRGGNGSQNRMPGGLKKARDVEDSHESS
jgi:hypothetical protein